MQTLPETIEVFPLASGYVTLDLSGLRYAVVTGSNKVLALFWWKDQAKYFFKENARLCRVIDIKTGELIAGNFRNS